jgi:hypothetical protein
MVSIAEARLVLSHQRRLGVSSTNYPTFTFLDSRIWCRFFSLMAVDVVNVVILPSQAQDLVAARGAECEF